MTPMAKPPKPARNHHWVSQCYLKGFATPVSKNSNLWAYDFADDHSFRPKPRGVAAKRDFNRIDIPGQPIDALEGALAEFETEVDAAIRATVAATDQFSSPDDFNVILNFIALLAVRNPRLRETHRDFRERTSKMIMNIVLSSKETYEHQVRKAKEAGFIDPDTDASYEDAKDFERRQQFRVELAREEHIRQEFQLHDTVLQTLGRRQWMVVRSTPEVGTFITCDHPVMLRPTEPSRFPQHMGFGTRSAAVLFPLAKHVFLVGEFDMEAHMMQADQQTVAALNAEVILAAERQVYASDDKFPFFDPVTEELKTGAQLSAASIPPVDEASTNDTDTDDENWDDVEAVHQSGYQSDTPHEDGQ